eukprot:g16984.t1
MQHCTDISGKFGAWLLKLAPQRAWWKGFHHTGALLRRLAPRPVYFLLPGAVAKGPPTALNAATCAWPLYIELCSDVVLLDSERWQKSPWTRMDALLAVWAKTPIYVLPEKYSPADDDAKASAVSEPLSFANEEPLTISRPAEDASVVSGGVK